jgi:ammonium transporter, Amt family
MTIETWLPALLGYLIPVGLFLLAWGGMEPRRARRVAAVGALAMALATLGYFMVGFAFHLGGAGLMSDQPGLAGLVRLFAGEGELAWGMMGLTGFFLADEAATPAALALFVTYLPLVATAVLLTVLSVSGRARGWQTAIGGLMVATLLFPLAACWTWGGGWLSNLGLTLDRGHGFVDHAGSSVVYLLGGMSALGALVGMGKRLPRSRPGEPEEMPPAHFPLLANVGALLFGLGWLGWSLSAPFHVVGAELNLPRIAANGLLAASGAIIVSQTYCWITVGHAEPLMSARGMAAGLVAVAAGAPFIPPWAAMLTGALAGLMLPLGVYLVERVLRLPDETATVALGVLAGIWGSLSVALFADGRWGQGWNGIGISEYHTVLGQGVTGFLPAGDFVGDGPGQLIAQLTGIGAIGLPAFLINGLVFFLMSLPYRSLMKRLKPLAEETIETGEMTKAEGQGEKKESSWLTFLKANLFPFQKPETEKETDNASEDEPFEEHPEKVEVDE